MERKILLLTIALITILAVVNATVYAYRWMTGTITVGDATTATGAACTGFYSSADQENIPLPKAGTNAGHPTYGSNRILVTPGNTACRFNGHSLYESINVELNITTGYWYIQDFYGFGYYQGSAPVYVYFRLEDDANDNGILETAILRLRNATNDAYVNELDLLQGTMRGPIILNPGDALKLDLIINATSTGSVSFRVGVYVTQTSGEAPTP